MKYGLFSLALLLCLACDDGTTTPTVDALVADVGQEDEGVIQDTGENDAARLGVLTLSTAALDFGPVALGGEAELELGLENTGDGPLTITALEGLAQPFSASRQAPIEIPAGASRTLVLSFRPTAAGAAAAVLRLVPDVGSPQEVGLDGEGVALTAELESAEVEFGVVAPGEPTAGFVRVRNLSPQGDVIVGAVNGVVAPFDVQSQLPLLPIAPGATGDVLIQFAPEADGDFEQAVTVVTNAGDFPVTLHGRAVSTGTLTITGVEPAWAPTDEAVLLTVHGGPFAAVPDEIRVGDVTLTDLERLDGERVRGVRPAGGTAAGTADDQLDVRVDIGPDFGLLTDGFVLTGPVAEGQGLDGTASEIGPAGNPWHLDVAEIAAGSTLTVLPGTVILSEGPGLDVAGVLRAGDGVGLVVFSAASRTAGAWTGLRLGAAQATSTLNRVVVEYAGAGEDGAALTTAQGASVSNLTVRQSAGHGLKVDGEGVLVLVGGELTDVALDALHVASPEATVFRLLNSRIRRCRWPLAAFATQFQAPLGAGHDWADCVHDAVGLRGDITADASLSNQPAGLRYAFDGPIVIAAGATWSLAAAAPLTLDGLLRIEGTLALPAGLRLEAAAGGRMDIAGTLVCGGTAEAPVVLEARAPGGAALPGTWAGLHFAGAGALTGGHLAVRDAGSTGPALSFANGAGELQGLEVADSAAVGLALGNDAVLTGLRLSGNAEGLLISGGSGRLEGISGDAAPAVRFSNTDLCPAWDLTALEGSQGAAVTSNCP